MTQDLSNFFCEEEYLGKTYPSCEGDLPTLFTKLTRSGLATVKHHVTDSKDPIMIIQLNKDVLLPIPTHRDEDKSMFEKGTYLSLHPQKNGTYGFSYFYEDVYQLWYADMQLSQILDEEIRTLAQRRDKDPVCVGKHAGPLQALCEWVYSFSKAE